MDFMDPAERLAVEGADLRVAQFRQPDQGAPFFGIHARARGSAAGSFA
jgi:hypothetical protein